MGLRRGRGRRRGKGKGISRTYGFPSFPNITPLGYFFGGTALAIGVFADSSCVSSAISTLMI